MGCHQTHYQLVMVRPMSPRGRSYLQLDLLLHIFLLLQMGFRNSNSLLTPLSRLDASQYCLCTIHVGFRQGSPKSRQKKSRRGRHTRPVHTSLDNPYASSVSTNLSLHHWGNFMENCRQDTNFNSCQTPQLNNISVIGAWAPANTPARNTTGKASRPDMLQVTPSKS